MQITWEKAERILAEFVDQAPDQGTHRWFGLLITNSLRPNEKPKPKPRPNIRMTIPLDDLSSKWRLLWPALARLCLCPTIVEGQDTKHGVYHDIDIARREDIDWFVSRVANHVTNTKRREELYKLQDWVQELGIPQPWYLKETFMAKKVKPAASLAGLVLKRLQDIERDSIEGQDTVIRVRDLTRIFGEALEQLTAKEEVVTIKKVKKDE